MCIRIAAESVCTAADDSSYALLHVRHCILQEVLAQSRRQDAAVGTGQDVRSVFTRRDIHQVRTHTFTTDSYLSRLSAEDLLHEQSPIHLHFNVVQRSTEPLLLVCSAQTIICTVVTLQRCNTVTVTATATAITVATDADNILHCTAVPGGL
jgi:hypothetical protein